MIKQNTSWENWSVADKRKIRRQLAEVVGQNEDLTHEHIELVLVSVFPQMSTLTVCDDTFHYLITEIYADYRRFGGVDQ